MRDLTRGSITTHILVMALPIAASLAVQQLNHLVDLYFVAQLGQAALAGVAAGGNTMFLGLAVGQILSVGTVATVSHAAGQKNRPQANLILNQASALALFLSLGMWVIGALATSAYLTSMGLRPDGFEAGEVYLRWFVPSMALQVVLATLGGALQGTGVVQPTVIVQMASVAINAALTPILVAGWGTGVALGVEGAGLATFLSTVVGLALLVGYFVRFETYVSLQARQWRPQLPVMRRVLAIGTPAGGQFVLMFAFLAVMYAAIAVFGTAAQAGYGVGFRIMNAVFLPTMAISFTVPAIAGQNFGAKDVSRMHETFWTAATMSVGVMAIVTMLCQVGSEVPVRRFTQQPETLAVASEYLRIISWNFVFVGIVFVCGGMFQAVGNTTPVLLTAAIRLGAFLLGMAWLKSRPDFYLEQVWYLSVATMVLQSAVSLVLLNRLLPTARPPRLGRR
ncbi:MAG: MATE family efflux transporter [Myxococcota bacterium]